MRVEIIAPGPWVSANDIRAKHWRSVQPQMRLWRDAAAWHCRAMNPMPFFTVPVDIYIVAHKDTRRLYDPSNLLGGAAKACIDGIVDAGVLVGDSPRYVRRISIEAGDVRKPGQLVIEIEPAP